ncbi:DUF775 domain-containing protein [Aphelenchoides bicaudatus]|nr:DUF775 domain-containing protein [Aphelenchoides bicaudatus]
MTEQQIFGVIVAGRALQTNFIQASEREFVIELPQSDSINHLVVLLTGVQLFPDNIGGSIYIQWPGEGGANWHYLGFISNSKPSAIFKIAQLASHKSEQPDSLFQSSSVVAIGNVMLGIIAEPLNDIASKTPAVTAASNQSTVSQFAQKMTSNLVDYLSSYIVNIPDPSGRVTEFIPVKAVQSWYQNFERRLQTNPNFWKLLQ